MNVASTCTGYRIDLDPSERDQVLLALELAAACRRGEDGRGALIRRVDSATVTALAETLGGSASPTSRLPIRADEAARWRVTDVGRSALAALAR